MNEQDAQEKRDAAEVPQINIEPLREVINEVVSNMNPVINALINDEALATIRGIVERLKSEHAPAFKYLEYLRTLEPYIKAEAESDEAYFTILEAVDLDFTTTSPKVKRIIDRAAERAYEAEGIEIIELSLIDTSAEARTNKKELAVIAGATTNIERLSYPSERSIEEAFTINSIFSLSSPADSVAFNELFTSEGLAKRGTGAEVKPIDDIHAAFLGYVMTAVMNSQATDNKITFYLPDLFKSIKTDTRAYSKDRATIVDMAESRKNMIMEMIRPFDNLVGRTADGSFYRLLAFEGYDAGTETITIITPYLYKVRDILLSSANQNKYKMLAVNDMLSPETVKTRNRAGVEIAVYITNKMLQIGEKQTTYRAKYTTIIKECPLIYKQIQEIDNDGKPNKAARINKKLQSAFNTAFKIIKSESEAPERFTKLKITPETPPTKSTLGKSFSITWEEKKRRSDIN